jgi:purine-binding chemotaxis protein CheW
MTADRLFCTFRLDRRLFGVPVTDVREVNAETGFSRIPHAPPEVRGYVNLRGHIHLALDLRRILGMEPAVVTPDSRLVIFKPSVGDAFGALVDSVDDIVSVAADDIEERRPVDAAEPGRPGRPEGGDVVAGVCKLKGELMVALDARRLLGVVERAMDS